MNDEQLMFDFAGTPEVTATYIKTLPGAEKGGVKKAFKFENHSVPTSGFSGFDDVDSSSPHGCSFRLMGDMKHSYSPVIRMGTSHVSLNFGASAVGSQSRTL